MTAIEAFMKKVTKKTNGEPFTTADVAMKFSTPGTTEHADRCRIINSNTEVVGFTKDGTPLRLSK